MALAALRLSRSLPMSLCATPSLAALNNAMSTASLPVADRATTGNAAPIALAEKQYQVLDRIKESFTVTRSQAYAVVGVGAAQYKVSPDDLIYVERLENVDVQDKVSLKHVHLLGSPEKTVIGRPLVVQASVLAVVEVSQWPGAPQACTVVPECQCPVAGVHPRCQGACVQKAEAEEFKAAEGTQTGEAISWLLPNLQQTNLYATRAFAGADGHEDFGN